jgi:phosphate transport system protein
MDKTDIGHHISQQFNAELEDIRNRVLAMGGLVEQQLQDAIESLLEGDSGKAEQVINNDHKVNAYEVAIDEECSRILARRQPTASDLRLVVAVIKTITDLERIGDEAEKIGHLTMHLTEAHMGKVQFNMVRHLGDQARHLLHGALDAFARMDVEQALQVARDDEQVDKEYESVLRQLITYMMEDSRAITAALDMTWTARALERIGDHSKNICEYVIYLVKGKDVRHTDFHEVEEVVHDER